MLWSKVVRLTGGGRWVREEEMLTGTHDLAQVPLLLNLRGRYLYQEVFSVCSRHHRRKALPILALVGITVITDASNQGWWSSYGCSRDTRHAHGHPNGVFCAN